MEKKTLQHFKDEVAREQTHTYGNPFDDWNDLENTAVCLGAEFSLLEDLAKAAGRYAQYLAGEAWEEACSAQKKICSDFAFLDCDCDSWEHCHGKVNISSILDAPTAYNPYKQKDETD